MTSDVCCNGKSSFLIETFPNVNLIEDRCTRRREDGEVKFMHFDLKNTKKYSMTVESVGKQLEETRGEFFEDHKRVVDKLFQFCEEDIEIRVNSIEIAIENLAADMHKRINKTENRLLRSCPNKDIAKFKKGKNFRKFERRHQMVMRYLKNGTKISTIAHFNEILEEMIGEISHPFPPRYNKIKSKKAFYFPFRLSVSLDYLKNKETIIVSDPEEKVVSEIDMNGNYLRSHNPNSVMDAPGALCVNNKNEVFVQDFFSQKILVFDSNFVSVLRSFGDDRLQSPFFMTIDETTNYLYASDYLNNEITLWDSEKGTFVRTISVFSPLSVQLQGNSIYILSAIQCEDFTIKNAKCESENNENKIIVLNRDTFEVVRKIDISSCIHPKGLYIDDTMSMFTTAYDINNKSKDAKCLCKLDEDGKCVQRTKLGVSGFYDLIFVGKKVVFTRGYRSPPGYIIEFK